MISKNIYLPILISSVVKLSPTVNVYFAPERVTKMFPNVGDTPIVNEKLSSSGVFNDNDSFVICNYKLKYFAHSVKSLETFLNFI